MKRPTRQSGFTLVELMIALGILGVGMAMIGTAFPTAILENRDSMDDMYATAICENAAAICRARLRHSEMTGLVFPDVRDLTGATAGVKPVFPLLDRVYPSLVGHPTQGLPQMGYKQVNGQGQGLWYRDGDFVGTTDVPASRFGWLIAGMQPSGDNVNDYLFLIVPYRKATPGAPTFRQVSALTKSDVALGAPVISSVVGLYAFVVGFNGNNAVLSNPTVANFGDWLTVGLANQKSPAIGCFSLRTALRP